MTDQQNKLTQNEPAQNNIRPALLTFLCILSFIGSGLSSVSNIFVFFNHELLTGMLDSGVFDEFGFDMKILTDTNKQYFIITGLLHIISFVGVRHMWNLRRAGFHIYAISQLLMLIVSTMFIYRPANVFPFFDLVLAAIFILMYLRFRDIMD